MKRLLEERLFRNAKVYTCLTSRLNYKFCQDKNDRKSFKNGMQLILGGINTK